MSKVDDGLRPIFRDHLPKFDWQSIETPITGSGVPDSNYCRNGREGWIEYKATKGYAVTLEPEQIGWICRRVRHGGRVWIAVRRRSSAGPRKGTAVDELWIIPGVLAKKAKIEGLRGLRFWPTVEHWSGGPTKWDWDHVSDLLTDA